jgi:hypothetical protein
LKGGRAGLITYEWRAAPGHCFHHAELQVGTGLQMWLAAGRSWRCVRRLTPHVRGRPRFRVQFRAANDSLHQVDVLKQFELVVKTAPKRESL